jgi:diguanylate cyclase (GGDEF)-like protein
VAFLDLLAHSTPGVGTVADAVRAALAGSDSTTAIDVPGRDGTWTAAQVQRFVGPGGGALVSFIDVSERKAHELELAHLATHDSLTRLPNRALMLDRLREALARAHRRGRPLAVLFVDLDGLKMVNDSEGHDAGDDMLRAAAERLARCCRVADTVARLGGDEFVVLLDEITDAAEAEALAARMLTSLREPGIPASRVRYVGGLSASIGVALADGLPAPTERDALDLVGHADAAMLVAKRSGKDQVVLIARPRPAGGAVDDQSAEA